MTKTAFALALTLFGAALGAQGAQAQTVNVDVGVNVQVVNRQPAARQVCNRFTCWIEQTSTPRSRTTYESMDHYERRTEERY